MLSPRVRELPEPPISRYYAEVLAPESSGAPSDPREGLWTAFLLIRRNKRTILATALIGAVLASAWTFSQKKLFQAHAILELQGLNGDFMNARQVDPTSLTPDFVASDSFVQTQMRILETPGLTERTMLRMKLNGQLASAPAPGPLTRIKRMIGLESSKPDPLSGFRKELSDGLVVRAATGMSRIISVQADASNPQVAAAFVNTLTAEYIQRDLEDRLRATENTRKWLTQQMEEMRSKLESSENGLRTYAQEHGLLFTSDKNALPEDKLRTIQQQLTGAQGDSLAVQSHLARINASSPETIPEVLSDKTIRDGKKTLIELNRQLAELNSQSGNDRKIAEVRSQVESVEQSLRKQTESIVERVKMDRQEVDQREKLLQNAYREQELRVTQDASKSIRYNILKREVDTDRQLYEGILQKVKESGFASEMRSSHVRVIDPAQVPDAPYKPNSLNNIAIGLLAGTLLGIAFVITRAQMDDTVQTPADFGRTLNLPVLAVIPSSGHHDPHLLTEPFRAAMLSVLHSRNGSAQRVIVVTSPDSRAGTTTVAANLAAAFASMNRKVLLVDGNLRQPHVHELFGIENGCGLIPHLRSGDEHKVCVGQTSAQNLFVLTGGPGHAHGTVVSCADRVNLLIQNLRHDFDIVIVDAPSMEFADARVFGRSADSVILVARAAKTRLHSLIAARERLSEDGIAVLGVILNHGEAVSIL